jgi:hypothetical protein
VDTSANPQHLRDLVARHKVVFELRPAYEMVGGHRLQVGFDVEVCGTHSQGVLEGHEPQPMPGCERCVAVFRDLVEIAKTSLPPEDRPTGYYIEPFDYSLHYFTKRRPGANRDRPDVMLTIEVRHREGFDREVDPCESRCAQEITGNLRALGVQEGTWSDYRAQVFEHAHPAPGG